MKRIASLILLASLTASAQVSTNCTTVSGITNCTTIGGNINANTNCTSIGNTTNCTTTGSYTRPSPPSPPPPITDTGSYQAGQAVGGLIAGLIIRHQFNSLRDQECRQNRAGSTWSLIDGRGYTYEGTCTDAQATVKPKKEVATKHHAFSYPECAQRNNALSAKACNARLAPDAPIVPACQPLATNNGGTQPEAYRHCAVAAN